MTRVLGLLCAAALLIGGMHQAAVRGLADAHYTRARLTLAEGRLKPEAPQPASVSLASGSLREALALEPSNPHFVEQAARLQEMRALGLPGDDPSRRQGLRLSLAQYRVAVAMRPGSPYAWASIALLKLRLGAVDAEFYEALERAAQLGPWEPAVQIAIADAGLAAWRRLALPAKALVIANLDRALLRQAPEVRRIAAAHGTLPLVCASSELPPRLRTPGLCVPIPPAG